MYVRTYVVWYCSCTMYVLVSQSCPAIPDSGGFIVRGGLKQLWGWHAPTATYIATALEKTSHSVRLYPEWVWLLWCTPVLNSAHFAYRCTTTQWQLQCISIYIVTKRTFLSVDLSHLVYTFCICHLCNLLSTKFCWRIWALYCSWSGYDYLFMLSRARGCWHEQNTSTNASSVYRQNDGLASVYVPWCMSLQWVWREVAWDGNNGQEAKRFWRLSSCRRIPYWEQVHNTAKVNGWWLRKWRHASCVYGGRCCACVLCQTLWLHSRFVISL